MDDEEILLPPAACRLIKVPFGTKMYRQDLLDRLKSLDTQSSEELYKLSKPLSVFVNLKGPTTKDVPMKRVIRYIKTNSLDTGPDWSIIPDTKLEKLLGKRDPQDAILTFANLKKYILRHLTPVESHEESAIVTAEAIVQTDPLPPLNSKKVFKLALTRSVRYILSAVC